MNNLKKALILLLAIFLINCTTIQTLAVSFKKDIYSIDSSGKYIIDIPGYTTIEEFKSNVSSIRSITISETTGEADESKELIKTGDKIIIGSESYIAVVLGDIDKDGKCTYKDILIEQDLVSNKKSTRYDEYDLTNELTKIFADLNHDGKVNYADTELIVNQDFPEKPEDGVANPNPDANSSSAPGGYINGKFTQYYQTEYDYPYGGGTIATSGCGPSCFAMIASTLTGRTITPIDAVSWCGNAYYVSGVGTSWAYFEAAAKHFNLGCIVRATESISEVEEALKQGKMAISSQREGIFTRGGHFIVLASIDNTGRFQVLDPSRSNAVDRGYNDRRFTQSEITASALQYWIFE